MIITFPTLIILLCVFAFFAVNLGDRHGNKKDLSVMVYVAVVCIIGYIVWPIVAPVVSPLITWWLH